MAALQKKETHTNITLQRVCTQCRVPAMQCKRVPLARENALGACAGGEESRSAAAAVAAVAASADREGRGEPGSPDWVDTTPRACNGTGPCVARALPDRVEGAGPASGGHLPPPSRLPRWSRPWPGRQDSARAPTGHAAACYDDGKALSPVVRGQPYSGPVVVNAAQIKQAAANEREKPARAKGGLLKLDTTCPRSDGEKVPCAQREQREQLRAPGKAPIGAQSQLCSTLFPEPPFSPAAERIRSPGAEFAP